MRIKTLEISGFKSFAQRARLHFGPGITGVVGPNGCGKSNVVDAIRWVMGEASAKHLRGRAMQDVIFAGAEGRSAQNMAEVTLVFENDGDVPEPYLSASEIAVTRRLFRDGTSEYLLNKSTVRLRDITDLFLGTGIGTRAYNIIEQGRITFVVGARPEERRQLIEEVAGITKFKVRKKAAERRMEATEQNLARVRDVVAELDRQLVTLRKQAERARAYRGLKEALYDLELHRASHEWLRLRLLAEHERQSEAMADRARAAEEEAMARSEKEAAEREAELAEREQAVAGQHEDVGQCEASLAAYERDLAHWQERAQQLHEQAARASQQADALGERLRRDEGELEAIAETEQQAGQDAAQAAAALAATSQAQQGAARDLHALDQQLARLRQEALAQVQAAAMQRGRIQSLSTKVEGADDALAAHGQQHQTTEGDLLAARTRAEEKMNEAALLGRRAETARAERDGHAAQQGKWEEELAHAASAARDKERQLAREQSRLHSLGEIVRRLDGYSDGVRLLLKKNKDGSPRFAGVAGVVAEVVEVPPAHERAIEAAMGERLQYLRVNAREQAHEAIATLKREHGGRGGFVPPTPALPAALPASATTPREGVFGEAKALVQAREGALPLVAGLLAGIVLVDTLATAEREAFAHPGLPCTWVTADGEWVDGRGMLGGGAQTGAGLLATRREIRQLTASTAALAAEAASLQATLKAATQGVEAARQARQAAAHQLQGVELEISVCRRDVQTSENEARRLAGRLAALSAEAERLAKVRAQASVALDEALAEASLADGRSDEGREAIAEAEAQRAARAQAEREAGQALTEARVQIAARSERAEALVRARKRLADDVAAAKSERQRALAEVQRAQGDAAALSDRGEEGRENAAARREQASALREAFAAASAQLGQEREAQRALGAALGERRRRVGQLQARQNAHSLAGRKYALEQAQWVALVRERHDVALEEALLQFHARPVPTAAQKREEVRLTRELKQMGAISLTAIDECEAVDARATFLRSQQEDLQQALQSLRQAVTRINKNSRERFVEAFEAVDAMFQKVYPRLFHGGSARLLLTESDDVLESGVDIVAMPPGKKLQNVTLLSGGEKALTATALVFSIFLIKPSPFCILDEVDAPLDEANVNRFNDMLREMRELSQFIVITHNKQTMLQMDRLYGITMEDAGMSKVVSVDLQQRQPGQAA